MEILSRRLDSYFFNISRGESWAHLDREERWSVIVPGPGTGTGSMLRSESWDWRTVSLLAPGPWLHHGQGRQVQTQSGDCVLHLDHWILDWAKMRSTVNLVWIITQFYNQFDWSTSISFDVICVRYLVRARDCLYFIEWNINLYWFFTFCFSQVHDL